jgi:hypothetical protein
LKLQELEKEIETAMAKRRKINSALRGEAGQEENLAAAGTSHHEQDDLEVGRSDDVSYSSVDQDSSSDEEPAEPSDVQAFSRHQVKTWVSVIFKISSLSYFLLFSIFLRDDMS